MKNKKGIIIAASFLLLFVSLIGLFHREAVFEIYSYCYEKTDSGNSSSANPFSLHMQCSNAVRFFGALIQKHKKHFESVIFSQLGSSNPNKSKHAFYLLSEENSIPTAAYIKLFNQTSNDYTRESVLLLLPNNNESEAFLTEKIRNSGLNPAIRISAILKLTDFNSSQCQTLFYDLLSDKQPEARAMAIMYLSRNAYQNYEDDIKEMTGDPDPNVRKAAQDAISVYGNTKPKAGLNEAIRNNDTYRIYNILKK